MEVQLYVYDLTRGMARAMSRQLLGIQIDAVYHTSLVFDNIEYFFGAGVQTCYAGQTHHGQPMEIIPMGTTHLPMETILDYLESLKQVYTPESYDLFAHNCNNFTNDFGMFLVGKGIPDHITGLPERVLDTPFGQMLRPQIDASMRSITQAEVPASRQPISSSSQPKATTQPSIAANASGLSAGAYGQVVQLTDLSALEKHMSNATNTCATIFFTSSTCAPCKIAYPTFDRLAEEHPRALFVKVDINIAREIAARYSIRATPTFMTFAKGVKQDEWAGADPTLLKSNVERVILQVFPPHPHTSVKIPSLQSGSLKPTIYSRVPPLDKLVAKLGTSATQPSFAALHAFVAKRNEASAKDAPLPDLASISATFLSDVQSVPKESRFAAVDLLRCAMIDSRVSGYFAEQSQPSTISTLIKSIRDSDDCPHNLRLVTIHLACNLFTSPLYVKEILRSGNDISAAMVQLVAASLIDFSYSTTRVAAASLAFNLASANYRFRRENNQEGLAESEQVELAASLVEVLPSEESDDARKTMLLALGYLAYFAPQGGELLDLCQALDAKTVLDALSGKEKLAEKVARLF